MKILNNIKLCLAMLAIIIVIQPPMMVLVEAAETERFSDVPLGHWADSNIHQLRALGITGGLGNNTFGLGKTMTRAEFVSFLVRLQGWQQVTPIKGSYTDNMDQSQWYFANVETALAKKVITNESSLFRPNTAITREEMAVMIVNSLGYSNIAKSMNVMTSPYKDVTQSIGAIILLKDFGIVNGVSATTFAPKSTAKREEAAAILMRMYNKLKAPIEDLNGFYAISGYSQKNLIPSFDTISYAWGNIVYDSTAKKVSLKVVKPSGYEEPIAIAKDKGLKTRLNIYGSNSSKIPGTTTGYLTDLLSDSKKRLALTNDILASLNGNDDFTGIVIDFEEMAGSQLRSDFSTFIGEIGKALKAQNKTLTVMVQPNDYYNAYDYKAIGAVADEVIMMAHDYNAKKLTEFDMSSGNTYTPVTPINQVYNALKAITDKTTGVADLSKVSLQLSFGTAQWAVNSSKEVVNSQPYTPDYAKLSARLSQVGTTITYDTNSQNPKAVYYNEQDQLTYVIWYEDSRSMVEKIKLGKMFGISDISIWRLGNIPTYDQKTYMDVMNAILKQK